APIISIPWLDTCFPNAGIGKQTGSDEMSPSDSIQVTAASTATPANITEFNTIAGLIFAQLYAHFPVVIDPDRLAIANSFGAHPPNESCFRKKAWPHSMQFRMECRLLSGHRL